MLSMLSLNCLHASVATVDPVMVLSYELRHGLSSKCQKLVLCFHEMVWKCLDRPQRMTPMF